MPVSRNTWDSGFCPCYLLRYLLFPAIPTVTQHYIHPGSRPHLGRQQRVTLGPVVDLDEPGVAAAPSSSCTWVFRSCGSQGHPREAMSWRGPVVAAPVCAGSSSCFGLLSAPSLASCFPWWPGCDQQHCGHSTSHPYSQSRCCWTLRETPGEGSLCFTA